MRITSFKELAKAASEMPKKTVVAVVEAHDLHTLEAVINAKKDNIIDGMLIGNEEKIREILKSEGADPADYTIIPTNGLEESLKVAVESSQRDAGRFRRLPHTDARTAGILDNSRAGADHVRQSAVGS